MQLGADTTCRNDHKKTALDVADKSTKQQMQRIVNTVQPQKSSSRRTDANITPENTKNKRSLLVRSQSDDEDSSTQVEPVKAAVSDVSKTSTSTEQRVNDVTNNAVHVGELQLAVM